MDELDHEDPVVVVESGWKRAHKRALRASLLPEFFARSTSRGGPVSAAAEPIKLTAKDWEDVPSAPSVWIRSGDETIEGSWWAKAQPVLEHRHDDPFFPLPPGAPPPASGKPYAATFAGITRQLFANGLLETLAGIIKQSLPDTLRFLGTLAHLTMLNHPTNFYAIKDKFPLVPYPVSKTSTTAFGKRLVQSSRMGAPLPGCSWK